MPPLLDFPPLRTLSVGPLTFHIWGLFVALGILTATFLSARRARRVNVPSADVWNLAFWVSAFGLLGARLLYVTEYWQAFIAEPWRVIAVWEGGMSAFGALLLGVPVAWWHARRRPYAWRSLAAAVSPSLLLGDAIGRLGGALSHMYPGKPTTFPIAYVLDGVQRHEVGIELSLASLIGFLVILWVEKRWSLVIGHPVEDPRFPRKVAWPPRGFTPRDFSGWSFPAPLVLGWYSLERFLLDFLRASDLPGSDLRYAGLTLAQFLALLGVASSLFFLTRKT